MSETSRRADNPHPKPPRPPAGNPPVQRPPDDKPAAMGAGKINLWGYAVDQQAIHRALGLP